MQHVFDKLRSHMRVMLRDVQTEAQVGLHAWERHPEHPTRLLVNVDMWAPHDAVAGYIDYERVRSAILDWPARPHTELLETLAEELVVVCFEDARVQACRVSVMKPDVFNDTAAVGVEFYRVRGG